MISPIQVLLRGSLPSPLKYIVFQIMIFSLLNVNSYFFLFLSGARVYLACRSDAEEVIKELKTKTKNEKIFAIPCDLSSLKSVESFVDAFRKSE